MSGSGSVLSVPMCVSPGQGHHFTPELQADHYGGHCSVERKKKTRFLVTADHSNDVYDSYLGKMGTVLIFIPSTLTAPAAGYIGSTSHVGLIQSPVSSTEKLRPS